MFLVFFKLHFINIFKAKFYLKLHTFLGTSAPRAASIETFKGIQGWARGTSVESFVGGGGGGKPKKAPYKKKGKKLPPSKKATNISGACPGIR